MHTQTRKIRTRTFKKKDYYNGDGMLTTVWGPSMWHYLHTMSFNYPVAPTPADKKHYRDFMLNLQYVLPCKYCRQNLTNNYKVFPLKANTVSMGFIKAVRRSKVEDFHFHDLRHMALTKLSNKFTNVLELAAISGHKELKMLQRYVHFKAEDLALKLI